MSRTVVPGHSSSSKIVLLGTGTPNADPTRSGPAVAVVLNQTSYVVDAGPGVVRQAAAAYKAGVSGLAVAGLKRLFVTHLHSDHTAGYPDFILTPWVLGRDQPLRVFGPPGIRAMTEHLLAAYQEDIRERLTGLEPANDKGCRVEVTEVGPGMIYADQNVAVEAFSVNHGSWPAFGYKFYAPDRTIAISGDTAPAEDLLDPYRDCDVLIHEVYSSSGLTRHSPAWQRYHSSVHTSSSQLADIASIVKPGLLILYHQLFHGSSEEELLREVQDGYSGTVVSGQDLQVY
jgi:ribonuclease BN (tRNA processing enzyme)